MRRILLVPLVSLPLAIAGEQSALAEIQSRDCPFSCQSAGIEKTHCKDWREGNICYVEDLRADHGLKQMDSTRRQIDEDARAGLGNDLLEDDRDLERKITLVGKSINPGGSTQIDLMDRPISRIDVVLRRVGTNTQTLIDASIGENTPLGEARQVDQNTQHVISFEAAGRAPGGEDLRLRASNGEVFVESVHVLYER